MTADASAGDDRKTGPPATLRSEAALDLSRAPWGSFTPGGMLAAARRATLALRGVPLAERWAYKLLTHFTRNRGIVADIDYAGLKWRAFLDENSHDRWLFRTGRHPEEEDFAVFEPYRGRGAVFVDIGANVGHFSLTAFRTFGGKGRIIAFEPHPRTVRKLRLNLALNGASEAVELHNLALGATRETLMLHEPFPGSDGGNTLASPSSSPGGRSVPVPVAPLAEVLSETQVERIDILKIDVEGYEDRVLIPFFDCAPRTLWPREVLIETTFGDGQHRWLEDPIERMRNLGYREQAQTRDNTWLALSGNIDKGRSTGCRTVY